MSGGIGWLLVFVFAIAMLCLVLGLVPSAGAIKLLLMFCIGFVIVWAGVMMFGDFDGKK